MASRYKRQLSSLPETGAVQARYCINVIGPDAREFVKLLQSATEYANVEEMASSHEQCDGDECTKIHFLVDEHEETIVRVHFNTVQDFSDDVTELRDQTVVRNTLFLFIVDVREATAQGLSVEFQSRLCQVRFQYDAARSRTLEKQFPCILSVMLFHEESANGKPLLDGSMPAELESFDEKLHEICDTQVIQTKRCVDFTKASLAYKCLTQVATEMYFADKSVSRKHSQRVSERGAGGSAAAGSSSRICALL
eukprot:TRINITY_DN63616_c0_g1_i1.p1 TRINITY_DN63616_c0_g1~~TRINITY_DN63616_c0_g1_i1.p1  ORF type:complete len:252 (+),score=38.01 TRINITY_DN63616_c0_g1_i1:65-820(+)